MVSIDGAAGEGGGQVLRSALALSALTGQTTDFQNIRAGRATPGLQPQHLTAVYAAAAVCGAQTTGVELNSPALHFAPTHPARPGDYVFDVSSITGKGSAGSVGLVMQTVLLPLAAAPGDSHLLLRGGTHVPWAPSMHYLQSVFLPTLASMGVAADIELTQWGFYPAGGGAVRVSVQGQSQPRAITLTERGALKRIWGVGVVSNLPAHIPQRMVNRARNLLNEAGLKTDLEPLRVRGDGPGAGIFLVAEYEGARAGFTAYGKQGLPADQVAQAACDALLAHHHTGAPVDPYLADQLILPMAVAQGTSHIVTSRITNHLLTNVATVQSFLPVVARIDGALGRPGTVTLTGYTYD
ncbi:MAG: RNA 3'-phosphate cyclase [Anaerolineae bacterium]|nr:RNA 3'-phosphate cyclase [Anaerolineae bacterium]